jgi:hypothetical protein
MNWFYALNGEQQGPVTPEQLDQLLAQGVINDATLVWREGLATWQPLATARPASTVPPVPAEAAAGTNPAPPVGGTVRCAECQGLFPESEVARSTKSSASGSNSTWAGTGRGPGKPSASVRYFSWHCWPWVT